MPSTKLIKQRIKSVKNTSQITKAMEVVSATKMRKSQEFALKARPYAIASLELLKNLLSRTPVLPPLLYARPVKISCLLVVTSDKGLAGAFNANVLKKSEEWILEKEKTGKSYTLVTVGKKAKEYFERRMKTIERSFTGFGDYSTFDKTFPVADLLLRGFAYKKWDSVDAVYMNFRSTLIQEIVLKKILPATKEGLEEAVETILPERGKFSESNKNIPTSYNLQATSYHYEYTFEPSAEKILEALVPQLLQMHIHHIILESNASEHSARMIAMKNASENAKELISGLTLEYNKSRQAGITRELVEITAGQNAM